MQKTSKSNSAFFNVRFLIGCAFCATGVSLALLAFGISSSSTASAQAQGFGPMIVGHSYHNDVSPALRDMPVMWPPQPRAEHEANPNPLIPINHQDAPDTVVQSQAALAPTIMGTILNFNGIPFPGVNCNCAPPDTNGDVGTTQYVQIVNEGYQVFDKTTGNSVLGPNSLQSIWSGFGGACENFGFGDPTVSFDQIANRWVLTQFASTTGGLPITDECIAVSTSDNATGSYNRYGFHLSSNFIDYPKTGVWPDAYYQSFNIFNSSGTAYLGPQPFAYDRAAMLLGNPATFVTTAGPLGSTQDPFLPSDLDGSTLPAAGTPNSYVQFPGTTGTYNVYHFHVDFAMPNLSTFTLFASPAAAPFTMLCPTTRNCVPQVGTTTRLDAIADRLMNRLAYRILKNGTETVVSNYTVKSNNVAGVRWFEIRKVTNGPVTVFQESTYQPDTTWRWMGSNAMDKRGNMALGFSASDATIHPQIRYAGRLRTDPINTLGLGEAHLFDGAGSQTDTSNRWGDYSCMAIDPVDDTTFWYTTEYYRSTSSFNWRTRIGSFKLQ
jgi:hypothetical protein